MWRIENADGSQWVQRDRGFTSASDEVTLAQMREHAGKPVTVGPIGQLYTPTGPEDEAGVFLLATWVVAPRPKVTAGQAPEGVPSPEVDAPPGAVI